MLSKKYNQEQEEKKWQEFWKEEAINVFDEKGHGPVYSIDTPPPTVNGKLHIGHIFSYTQAEMIARYHRAKGERVFYPFGFDDNGLPTERLVEEHLGIKGKEMEREDFTKACLEVTKEYEEDFTDLWMSLGFSCDWSKAYQTISPRTQRISQRSFIKLFRDGKVYRQDSPVLHCPQCNTSIAQAEVERVEEEGFFYHLRFQVEDEELIVATTRPELLYGCQRIFIHPEDKKRQHLIGQKAITPIYGKEILISSDEEVAMDKGTGAVMCCTFGDAQDMIWQKTYDLPITPMLDDQGHFLQEIPLIGGTFVKKGRKLMVDALKEAGALLKEEKITHPVTVHERCGHPVEIIPSPQWYIAVLDEKEQFIEAGKKIRWYPSHMEKRYEAWVRNLKWDWCISRQRFFGVPFPLWYCQACGEVRLAKEEELPVNPLKDAPKEACHCGHHKWVGESAVMDTWATSSLTPLINQGWGEAEDRGEGFLPMGMRTQAHEIIRTWAFYTIVMSIYHTGKLPWKDIMICGFVLAKKGEKISKSKKNANLSPEALLKTHGADTIRYWAASSKLGTDTTFSEEELKISRRFLTKLWNASKFSLMHLEDYQGQKPDQLLPQDKWIISKVSKTLKKAKTYLDAYELGLARNLIDDFFWNDYCDDYLELVKDRLYKPEIHGITERRSAQYAIYQVLLKVLQLYSIFVPHITEEIYQAYFQEREEKRSIHQFIWQEITENHDLSFEELIHETLSAVRKYKAGEGLSMKAPVGKLSLTVSKEMYDQCKLIEKDLLATTHAEVISFEVGQAFSVRITK